MVMCPQLMTKGPFMCGADRAGFCEEMDVRGLALQLRGRGLMHCAITVSAGDYLHCTPSNNNLSYVSYMKEPRLLRKVPVPHKAFLWLRQFA